MITIPVWLLGLMGLVTLWLGGLAVESWLRVWVLLDQVTHLEAQLEAERRCRRRPVVLNGQVYASYRVSSSPFGQN